MPTGRGAGAEGTEGRDPQAGPSNPTEISFPHCHFPTELLTPECPPAPRRGHSLLIPEPGSSSTAQLVLLEHI